MLKLKRVYLVYYYFILFYFFNITNKIILKDYDRENPLTA